MTMGDEVPRMLFELLMEHEVGPNPVFRKRLAIRLAQEGVTPEELARKCARLDRVEQWVRFFKPKTKSVTDHNMPRPQDVEMTKAVDIEYVLTRVLEDGKSVEFVAEQMGWTVERVLEVVREARPPKWA